MVPDELTEAAFYAREDVVALLDEGKVPLGLDLETVEPVTWDLKKGNLLYIFEQINQNVNMMRIILKWLQLNKYDHYIFSISKKKSEYQSSVFPENLVERKNLIGRIYNLVFENLDLGEKLHNPIIIIWDEIGEILQEDSTLGEEILYILEKGPKVGILSLIMSSPSLSSKHDSVSIFVKKMNYAVIEARLNDQKIIYLPNVKYNEPILDKYMAYIVENKGYIKFKLVMEI